MQVKYLADRLWRRTAQAGVVRGGGGALGLSARRHGLGWWQSQPAVESDAEFRSYRVSQRYASAGAVDAVGQIEQSQIELGLAR